jgi:SAM-dependent methyltransferase
VQRSALQTWESAEITRSQVEATLTPRERLALSQRTLTRYLSPPEATPYPLEYAFHVLGDVRGRRVVDFGCGSGANSVLLARRGASVVGIDISISLLQIGQERLAANGVAGEANFVVGSAHDLPLAAGSVDVVFGIAILHHLDLEMVAREVHRVLKPGGRAIFQEPVRNSRVLRWLRRLIPYRAPDISPFERPLTDRELRTFAGRFSSVRARPFTLPLVKLAMFVPAVRRRPDRWYEADAWLLRRLPFLRSYATIRVLELTR